MGQTREQKVLKQLTQTPQVQKLTPISEGMFLPNHSGIHHNLKADSLQVGSTITLEWDDFSSSNLISSSQELSISSQGDLWLSSLVTGDIYLATDNDIDISAGGVVYIGSDLLPYATATKDLGSSSYKWEDIHTNGDIYIYKPTTNDYKITSDSGGHLAIEGQTSGAQVQLALYSKDGDGTDGVFFGLVGKGTIADSTTALEKLNFRYAAGTTNFVIFTQASGTGTVRPLTLYTGANTSQLVLNIDGTTTITNGIYNSSDGTAGMTGTKTFLDATARTNTITIKNGLITAWSQC